MGYIAHHAVLVTVSGYVTKDAGKIRMPDVNSFRASLPPEWAALVVGPVPAVINDYLHFVFLPDGSKEGWDDSDKGDAYREQFAELFSACYEDGSSPFDVALVRYGGDEPHLGHVEDPRA